MLDAAIAGSKARNPVAVKALLDVAALKASHNQTEDILPGAAEYGLTITNHTKGRHFSAVLSMLYPFDSDFLISQYKFGIDVSDQIAEQELRILFR